MYIVINFLSHKLEIILGRKKIIMAIIINDSDGGSIIIELDKYLNKGNINE